MSLRSQNMICHKVYITEFLELVKWLSKSTNNRPYFFLNSLSNGISFSFTHIYKLNAKIIWKQQFKMDIKYKVPFHYLYKRLLNFMLKVTLSTLFDVYHILLKHLAKWSLKSSLFFPKQRALVCIPLNFFRSLDSIKIKRL